MCPIIFLRQTTHQVPPPLHELVGDGIQPYDHAVVSRHSLHGGEAPVLPDQKDLLP